MVDIRADEFVLSPKISDRSDGNKEKECDCCINLKSKTKCDSSRT
jgi:hypothetical protein